MQVDVVLATVFGHRAHESCVGVTNQDQNCEFIQVEYLTKVVDRDVSHVHDPAEFRVPRLMPELNVMVMQMGHHLTNSGSRNLGVVREDESVFLTDDHGVRIVSRSTLPEHRQRLYSNIDRSRDVHRNVGSVDGSADFHTVPTDRGFLGSVSGSDRNRVLPR